MKIYDCFSYYDEDLLLDLRLNILNDYVDYFVILEAGEDHQGNIKKKKFCLEKFKKFKHKIKYFFLEKIIIDKKINLPKNWDFGHLRDQSQRNYIQQCISEASNDDLIIISDLDEIPNPEAIKKFDQKYKYAFFKQKFFYYKFNLLNLTQPNWFGSRICQKKYLKSPQWLRNIKIEKKGVKKFFQKFFSTINILENGGWHFSYLKDPKEILKKIKSFAHGEPNMENLNEKEIAEKIINQKDLFDRNLIFRKVELDLTFPVYLLQNKHQYNDWII